MISAHRFCRAVAATLALYSTVLLPQAAFAAKLAPWVGSTLDGRTCNGSGDDARPKFNYYTEKGQLPVVERFHFTPEVEHLIAGKNSDTPIKDINYTLVKYPNHPRALYSAIRFSLSDARPELKKQYPPECYLQRAVAFAPQDHVAHMLYGLYLHRRGVLQKSLASYQAAEALAPNDPNLLYNMGLLYYDLKNYPTSYQYAIRAYGMGVNLPALKRKLQDVGYWK